MANAELEKTVGQLESVKVSRRLALKLMGAAILATAGTGYFIRDWAVTEIKEREIKSSFKRDYPPVTEQEKTQYEKRKDEAIDLLEQGKVDEARNIVTSDEFIQLENAIQVQKDGEKVYQTEYQRKLDEIGTLLAKEPALGFFGGLAAFSATPALWYLAFSYLRDKKTLDKITAIRPDWSRNLPSLEEVRALEKASSYLPPIGGKIILFDTDEDVCIDPFSSRYGIPPGWHMLDPTHTAEEQTNQVVEFRRKNELGRVYVHQLSVQGRLPDNFKYASLALILHSPYLYDWNEPFFEAEWGKVTPLVHDGGNVKENLNPYWTDVRGRTDFIQRIYLVQEPELDKLEKQDADKRRHLSFDRQVAARADQLEEERLWLEGRFYQRAAFALHSHRGTAPGIVPQEIIQRSSVIWTKFEEQMRCLLKEYDIEKAGNVTWFLDEPRDLPGWLKYGRRYEADWDPIKETLLHLEEVRAEYPEIRDRVSKLLQEVTTEVDHTLGFPYHRPYQEENA